MSEEETITAAAPEVKPKARTRKPLRKVKRAVRKAAPPVVQAAQEPEEEEAPVKKHAVTAPWKRAKILDVHDKPGFVRRWCTTTKIGNIEKKLDEGWRFVSDGSGIAIPRTIHDGKAPVDGVVRRRELILMELPMERKEARDRWLEERTVTPEKMAARLEKDMQDATGRSGKSIFTIDTSGG